MIRIEVTNYKNNNQTPFQYNIRVGVTQVKVMTF